MSGPVPAPTPETAPFWKAAARGELMLQRCIPCHRFYFYPRPFCPQCGSSDVEWERVSGRATLASYIINYRPLTGERNEPQVIALVQLEEGPRLMTNIVNIEPVAEALSLDMALEVTFEPRGDMMLPVFTPAEAFA